MSKNKQTSRDRWTDEHFREWQSNRRKQYIDRISQLKLSIGKCIICGWSEHPEILQFDHIVKEEKRFSFAVGGLGNYSWERTILPEIEKCKLVCPNCHAWRHFNEKNWFKEKGSKGGMTTSQNHKRYITS